MLSLSQEKLIRSLHTKKGRQESGLMLIEGEKNVNEAGDLVEYAFTPEDSRNFEKLVTTETPQSIAAVVKIPEFSIERVEALPTLVVLDHVQDPGNVGNALRLAQAFKASVMLVESADPTGSKAARSSAGAVFKTPWLTMTREEAETYLAKCERAIIRLELREDSQDEKPLAASTKQAIIVGSEGQGIKLQTPGVSVAISQEPTMESLNAAQALGIALHYRYLHSK